MHSAQVLHVADVAKTATAPRKSGGSSSADGFCGSRDTTGKSFGAGAFETQKPVLILRPS